MLERWRDLFAGLGDAGVELLRAELDALFGDFRGTARRLLLALVIALVAMSFGIAAIALFTVLLIVLLDRVLPLWGATLVVLGVVSLTSALLVLRVRGILRSTEWPGETVRRHGEELLAWWQSEVLSEEDPGAGGPLPLGGAPAEGSDRQEEMP